MTFLDGLMFGLGFCTSMMVAGGTIATALGLLWWTFMLQQERK